MRRRLATVLSVMVAAMLALPAHAQSATWTTLATTSGTLVPGSLCTTDGKDLTCNQSLSGLMSPDRITSGTTSIIAISNTGYISLTQSGVNTAYFHPSKGLVTAGVSTTGTISGSAGYFGSSVYIGGTLSANSYIGAARLLAWLGSPGSENAPAIGQYTNNSGIFFPTSNSIAFSASGTESLRMIGGGLIGIGTRSPTTALEVSGTVSATRFVGDGSGLTGTQATVASGTSGSLVYRDQNGGLVASSNLTISSTTGSVGVGVAAPSGLGNNALYAGGSLGTAGNFIVYNSDQIFNSVANPQSLIWGGSGGGIKITGDGRSGQNYMNFTISGFETMRIVSTGYVGIGETSPKVKLDIGNSSFKLGGEGQYIGFNGYYNSSAASWKNTAAGSYVGAIRMGMQNVGNGGDIEFVTQADAVANSTSDTNATVSRRMIVRRAGDVRMGGSLYVGSLSTTPTTSLEVSGTVSATRFVGDGSGLSGIAGSSVSMSVDDLTDATSSLTNDNLFIGSGTSGLNTGVSSTAIGLHAFANNTTGARSTALGSWALTANTTGDRNTAIGNASMRGNTTGYNNVALGQASLVYNTIGLGNTAVGQGAMTNTSGNFNVAVGTNALAGTSGAAVSSTIAIGASAAETLAAGERNTVIGYYASRYLTSGSENLLIGTIVAPNLTSGNGNIIIGTRVNAYAATIYNYLNISNTIVADMTSSASQRAKVGINVISPTSSFEVSGTVSATDVRFSGNATLPTGKCASATDEGRMVMTANGPYVCLLR